MSTYVFMWSLDCTFRYILPFLDQQIILNLAYKTHCVAHTLQTLTIANRLTGLFKDFQGLSRIFITIGI